MEAVKNESPDENEDNFHDESEDDYMYGEVSKKNLESKLYYVDDHNQSLSEKGRICETVDASSIFNAPPQHAEYQVQTGTMRTMIKAEAHKIRSRKNGKMWECETCHKKFSHQYILMRHVAIHSDERKYVCQECGKAFRQMSTLSQHRAIHSEVRPHVCEVCKKTFNRVSTLISHRKTHTGEKQHQCNVCGKAFHQKGNLRNHIFTHTNERPYKCETCKKGFNQMSNLVCHKIKAHQSGEKTKYECKRCGKSFDKSTELRNHEQFEHGDASTSAHVQYTTGVMVPKIETRAMQKSMVINQIAFAVVTPMHGTSVLVRIHPAGDKHMLIPASSDDLKRHRDACLLVDETGHERKCHLKIPVVAHIIQRRQNGVAVMNVFEPGLLPDDVDNSNEVVLKDKMLSSLVDENDTEGNIMVATEKDESCDGLYAMELDIATLEMFEFYTKNIGATTPPLDDTQLEYNDLISKSMP